MVGLAVRVENILGHIPQAAKYVAIGSKKKRGRPSKAKQALTKQPKLCK